MRITGWNAALAALGLFAVGCSDSMVSPPSQPRAVAGHPAFVINPVLAGAVVAGADGGAFTNPTVPTEATRVTGAFWDNVSSDYNPFSGGSKCNIGFFVTGAFGHGACLLETAGTQIPSGFGGNYWGDNGPGGTSAGKDASSFTFGGQYQYDVTLIGAFSSGTSEVGWFTHDGTGYHFTAVPAWSNKSIGTTVNINTGGPNWGLYIKNGALTPTGSCDVANGRACSDATGNSNPPTAPFQQFSLFINHDGSQLIAGIEDNGLTPLWAGNDTIGNPTNKDSDYQDYILSIVPKVIPPPPVCDFITFGRLVTAVGDDKIVISGNAGGNAPGGGILGTIEISVGGVQYHVPTIESYGLTTSGVLFPDPFARVITGHSGTHLIELRLRDNPNPGQGEPGTTEGDKVWLKIDNTVVVPLQTLDKGNIQLHLNCRGPGD